MEKELIGTLNLLDVAPWWYPSDLEQVLGKVICRSLGEIRTATRRIIGENVVKLVGKVDKSNGYAPYVCYFRSRL